VATPSPARLPPSGEATDEPPWSEVVVELPLPPPALGAGAGSSLEPGDGLVAEAIQAAVRNYVHDPPRVVAGLHRPFVVGAKTLVMGVVNVTPDSFSDGGEFLEAEAAFSHGLRLVDEGADLLDIGGESTRPGASDVSPEAEWARVGPVIARLHGTVSVPISVDTRHAEVAARALDAGADLVNDVSGLRDAEMRRVVARSGAPAIAMHMRGTPATMQANLAYRDVVGEVYDSLVDAARSAVSDGIAAEQLLIDPGLGFGKSAGQNLELLGRLAEFRSMGFPVVVGASRKSFLGWVVGKAPLGDRLEAGLAAAVLAARARAHVVRTHDVAPTVRVLALADAVVGRTRPAPPR
jgi:dihydropteroate synthase